MSPSPSPSPTPTPVAAADLAVTVADGPDPVKRGKRLQYNATVTNAGPATASSTVFRDELPAGVTLVSATTSQGSCTQADGTVTCALGSVAQGASISLKIVVTPSTVGSIVNTASVSSTTADPDGSDNASSVTTTVRA